MKWLVACVKRWREPVSRVITFFVAAILLYWVSQNYQRIFQLFANIGIVNAILFIASLTLAYLASVAAFVALVRSFGQAYPFMEGYHTLNMAQIATLVPGGIWSFVSIGGSLWAHGISKENSSLIVALNTLFGLSACILVGALTVAVTFGWQFALLCLVPVIGWLAARSWLENLRRQLLPKSSALPTISASLVIFGFCMAAWGIEATMFVWLLHNVQGDVVSPFLAASSYAASYFVGFIFPFTPAGLGIRETVLVSLLNSSLTVEAILVLSVSFRLLQFAAQWLNIMVTVLLRIRHPLVSVR